MEETRSSQFRTWPVVDEEYFLGMLSRETLEVALVDGRMEQPLKNIVETLHVPHLHMDHALHMALERMSTYNLDVLPVVHRADIHSLLGVVTLRDVLDSYGIDHTGSR
jgi:CIC family chloride channel protein